MSARGIVLSVSMALSTAASAQNAVWVVDAAMGSGSDFADIQLAVDAAAAGDTVLVRDGSYSSFTVDGKALRVVAEASARPLVREGDAGTQPLGPEGEFTTVEVRNLAAGQIVLLRGLDVLPKQIVSAQGAPPSLLIRDNAGSVWVEDCAIAGNTSEWLFPGADHGAAGAEVRDSAFATFTRCSLVGRAADGGGSSTSAADPGLMATGSSVALYECLLRGGVSEGTDVAGMPGPPPSHGAEVTSSFLYASGCDFRGGDGTDAFAGPFGAPGSPGSAGDGLRVLDAASSVEIVDCAFAGGEPALGQPPGLPIVDPFGVVDDHGGTARSFSIGAPVRAPGSASLVFGGAPFDLVFAWYDPLLYGAYFELFLGIWLPGLGAQLVSIGVADETGCLSATVPIGPLGPGAEGVAFFAQAVGLSTGASIFLGEGTAVSLVSSAIPTPSGPACLQDDLTRADPGDHDELGRAVSLDGPRLLAGAPSIVLSNGDTGSATLFERKGDLWIEGATLTPSSSQVSTFGEAVALDGDRAAIGAPNDDTYATDGGTVHVFHEGPSGWDQVATLRLFPSGDYDRFGRVLQLEGDTLAIGAAGRDVFFDSSGLVAMYEWSGSAWAFDELLFQGDPAAFDSFGSAVALDGDRILAAASGKDAGASSSAGAAYVFERSGGSWSQVQKLVGSNGAAFDFFGSAVALDGDLAVIGASGRDPGGAAYVFERTGSAWFEVQVLEPALPALFFGASLALEGDTLLVGSATDATEPGAVWSFDRSGGTFVLVEKIVDPTGEGFDGFGGALDLEGSLGAIGSRRKDGIEENEGAVFVHSVDGSDCP